MSELSAACCKTSPPPTKEYNEKGTYETFDGTKTYVTGPASATSAILVMYDIFGFYPQTIEGADVLATTVTKAGGDVKVFMPDFFKTPADIKNYPSDTPEKQKALGEWFMGNALPENHIARIPLIVKDIESKYPEIKSWGMMGHCWGGKMVTLSAGEGTLFKVGAQCHPSLIAPGDAESVTIPMIILASKDEDATVIADFEKGLKTTHVVETYDDQVHGWMAAKADFSDPKATAEFYRGYDALKKFFAEHL